MKLVTSQQMQEIDRISIQERGIPGFQLMEKAGRAIALDITDHFEAGAVVLLCGKGNNGGDGFVVARYLAKAGWRVTVVYIKEPDPGSGEAREAWESLPGNIDLVAWEDVDDLAGLLGRQDVAVDALLGTGAKGSPRPPFDEMIKTLNAANLPVFSVDIPSGLHPEEGTAELAVQAFRTITMGLPKIGMVTSDGVEYCGGIRVERLGFPKDVVDATESPYSTLTLEEAARLLPPRPRGGHKGTFGLLLLAAGSRTMPGAAVLSGMGALRGGCGLVRMLSPASVNNVIASHLPEVLLSDACRNSDDLQPLDERGLECVLIRTTAIAFGPGIGTSDRLHELLEQLLDVEDLPKLIDADGLNLLAEYDHCRDKLSGDVVLTPHPGELSRLTGKHAKEIQADRWTSAREAAMRFGCTVVLKGAGTMVAEPNGHVTHIPSGNTAWARGGAGDILTGVIGSLLAQRMSVADAAKLGTFVHGLAADIFLRRGSPRGTTTSEVAACLPQAFRELEQAQASQDLRPMGGGD